MTTRRDRFALLFLTLLVTLLWSDVLLLGRGPFQRDLTVYHYPMKKVVRDIVERGDFPSWNPLYSAGQPLAANPAYEVFYPPQWLIFLGSFRFGYFLHIIIHFYIAAFGMYLLLRRLGCLELSATFGATVFVMGGPYMSLVKLLPFLFSISWVPLIAFHAHRVIHEGRRRSLALGASAVAMQALIAEPTTLLQTWSVILAWAVWANWPARKKEGWPVVGRPFLRTAAMLTSGLCLASVQMIPAVEFTRDTVRSTPFSFQLVSHWSMAVTRPFELLFPSWFRQLRLPNGESRLTELYPLGDPFIADLYIGLLAVLLLPLFVRVRHRAKWFVAGTALVAYLVAIGKNTPLLVLLFKAGIFREIRYPEKFFLTVFVMLVVGAALLFDRLLREETDARDARLVRGVAVLWSIVAALALLTSSSVVPPRPESALEIATFGFEAVSERWYWLVNVARGAGLVVLLFAFGRLRQRRTVWAAAAIAFVVMDLWYLQRALAPRVEAKYFEEPASAAVAREQLRGGRLLHAADWDWAAASPASEALLGDGRMQPWAIRNGLFPRTPASWNVPLVLEQDFDETHLLITRDLLDTMSMVRSRRPSDWVELFGAMTNATVAAEFSDPASALARSGADITTLEPVRFRALPENPRYYFAEQYIAAADRADIIAALAEQSLHPRVAFSARHAAVNGGSVDVVSETSNGVSLRTRNESDALLVASVTRHRHWRATVDGKPVVIEPVNVAFMGVIVPRGEHVIAFSYRNPWFAIGAAVSLITALSLALIAWRGERRVSAAVEKPR